MKLADRLKGRQNDREINKRKPFVILLSVYYIPVPRLLKYRLQLFVSTTLILRVSRRLGSKTSLQRKAKIRE
jgi:hypothetical protein